LRHNELKDSQNTEYIDEYMNYKKKAETFGGIRLFSYLCPKPTRTVQAVIWHGIAGIQPKTLTIIQERITKNLKIWQN